VDICIGGAQQFQLHDIPIPPANHKLCLTEHNNLLLQHTSIVNTCHSAQPHHSYPTYPPTRSNNRHFCTANMSAHTSIQYMYIPNLVGRQILRVPLMPCESQTLDTTPSPSFNAPSTAPIMPNTTYSRDTSPTLSTGSVSDEG
jgi:hypothetical protein